jgi:hypothetical protein
MSENFDEVLSAALQLSPGARAMLADHLLESLDWWVGCEQYPG